MSRPTDWSALGLDQDPTPGEPASLRDLAHHVRGVADSIRTSLVRFDQLNHAEDDFWKSESGSAEGFKELKGELPGDMELAAQRYGGVSEALDGWIEALGGVQSRADDALRRANDARDDLAYANNGITQMREWKQGAERTAREQNEASPTEPPVEPEQWTGQDFYALKADAEQRLRRAKEDVGSARTDRDTASNHAGNLIEEAYSDKLQNKPWWRKALLVLVDVLQVVTAIVGILALFFPILAPLALLLGVITAGLTLVLVLTGDKKWSDLALELVGLATFGVGRLATSAVRAAKLAKAGRSMNQMGATFNKAQNALSKIPKGKFLSGLMTRGANGKMLHGGKAAGFLRGQANAAGKNLDDAISKYNSIKNPVKPTWSGTFGSMKNMAHTAQHSLQHMKGLATFSQNPGARGAGLAVVGAELTHVAIDVNLGVKGATNLITQDKAQYKPWEMDRWGPASDHLV